MQLKVQLQVHSPPVLLKELVLLVQGDDLCYQPYLFVLEAAELLSVITVPSFQTTRV